MKIHSFVNTLATSLALSLLGALPASAQSIAGQGTWETTLLGRDVNLQAVSASSASAVYLYDTSLNVTWLRDANTNAGNGNGGVMDWTTATNWAANLVTGTDGSAVNDWRLPTMTDTGWPGCEWTGGGTDCGYNPLTATSEMANLFFITLGNKSEYDTRGNPQADSGMTNAGSFQNMKRFDDYWIGTEVANNADYAWRFCNCVGIQYTTDKDNQSYALAVRAGDVLSPVPEPDTYPMLLLGLGLLGVLTRRRARALGTWNG